MYVPLHSAHLSISRNANDKRMMQSRGHDLSTCSVRTIVCPDWKSNYFVLFSYTHTHTQTLLHIQKSNITRGHQLIRVVRTSLRSPSSCKTFRIDVSVVRAVSEVVRLLSRLEHCRRLFHSESWSALAFPDRRRPDDTVRNDSTRVIQIDCEIITRF